MGNVIPDHVPAVKKVIILESDLNNLMMVAEARRIAILKVLETSEKLKNVIEPYLTLIDKGGIAISMKIPAIISDIKANAGNFKEVFSEEFLQELKALTKHEISRQ